MIVWTLIKAWWGGLSWHDRIMAGVIVATIVFIGYQQVRNNLYRAKIDALEANVASMKVAEKVAKIDQAIAALDQRISDNKTQIDAAQIRIDNIKIPSFKPVGGADEIIQGFSNLP